MYQELTTHVFNGSAGVVDIDENGDRVPAPPTFALYQWHASQIGVPPYNGFFVTIGVADDGGFQLVEGFSKDAIVWRSGTNDIPTDSVKVLDERVLVSSYLVYAVWILAALGLVLALFFLSFQAIHKRNKIMKTSSTSINVSIVGIVLMYAFVATLGIDGSKVDDAAFAGLCTAKLWLLLLGTGLAFSPLVAKKIPLMHFGAPAGEEDLKKPIGIQNWKLVSVIVLFLVLDIIAASLWTVLCPSSRLVSYYAASPIEIIDDMEVMRRPFIDSCQCDGQDLW